MLGAKNFGFLLAGWARLKNTLACSEGIEKIFYEIFLLFIYNGLVRRRYFRHCVTKKSSGSVVFTQNDPM